MAKPLQKERENRSADKRDLAFHPFNITAETAHTAVKLLETSEPEVLCQTLRAISKFAAQDMLNREILYNLNAIKNTLQHIDNPEINIKRFALRLLGQMSQLPRGPEQILEDPENVKTLATLLAKTDDPFVQEFSSLVLCELTKEPVGCERLVATNLIGSLFLRMKTSPDPDVQNNCLQISSNLLSDPVTANEVPKNPQFNWPTLFHLMTSEYLAIQHAAINIVHQLICRHKDTNIQNSFQASTGIMNLCDILESYKFRDVHEIVLDLLCDYVETDSNAMHCYNSGCLMRLLTYLEMALPAMQPPCLRVLTKLSSTVSGRATLYETKTDLIFCNLLTSSNPDIKLIADAALGIANMTYLMPSLQRMSETNVTENLTAILGDESAPWFDMRLNTLMALSKIATFVPKAAFYLVEPKNFSTLENVIRKYTSNPIEAQRLAMQCLINIEVYKECLNAMTNSDFILEMIQALQRPDIQLKKLTCKVLSNLMVDPHAQELFTRQSGEMVMHDNLTIEHPGLRTAVCQLMIDSVTQEGADVYLQNGCLHYMTTNKQARYAVPAWESALESIFRYHPSAKLAYTGRLDITDYTLDGFYVMKRMGEQFRTMSDLLRMPAPHYHPVFVCRFIPPPGPVASDSYQFPYRLSTDSNDIEKKPSLEISDDPYLRNMLLKMMIWLGEADKSMHILKINEAHSEVNYRETCREVTSTLKQKAQVLAEFVAVQMSGLTHEKDCAYTTVDVHLVELMVELRSCVVGLGWVKCGGALERAVLYKVLADRLGLPCALYRATNAHAWCEIAVPEHDPNEAEAKFPAGLLRVNYVVDLMSVPAKILLRGSYEANQVTSQFCNTRYTSCKPDLVCACQYKHI